jgi:hypothetical protein
MELLKEEKKWGIPHALSSGVGKTVQDLWFFQNATWHILGAWGSVVVKALRY